MGAFAELRQHKERVPVESNEAEYSQEDRLLSFALVVMASVVWPAPKVSIRAGAA
jgi:hypothetical protein